MENLWELDRTSGCDYSRNFVIHIFLSEGDAVLKDAQLRPLCYILTRKTGCAVPLLDSSEVLFQVVSDKR
jgi:hypothetical protein